jgi:hypothetical protein
MSSQMCCPHPSVSSGASHARYCAGCIASLSAPWNEHSCNAKVKHPSTLRQYIFLRRFSSMLLSYWAGMPPGMPYHSEGLTVDR